MILPQILHLNHESNKKGLTHESAQFTTQDICMGMKMAQCSEKTAKVTPCSWS